MNKNLEKQLIRWGLSCFIMSFVSEIIDWNTWLFVGAAIAFLISLVICDSETEKQKEKEAERIKAEEIRNAEKFWREYEQKKQEKDIDGEVKIYYSNGNLASLTVYKNGVVVAPVVRYSENGKLLNGEIRDGNTIISYKKGKKDGLEIHYAEDGKITSEEHWKNGMRAGVPNDYYSKKFGYEITFSFPNGIHKCIYGKGKPVSLEGLDTDKNLFI